MFCFETEVFDDGLIEPKETVQFGFLLLTDTFPSVISPSSVTLTIVDNDGMYVLLEDTILRLFSSCFIFALTDRCYSGF